MTTTHPMPPAIGRPASNDPIQISTDEAPPHAQPSCSPIRDAKVETWEDHVEAWNAFGRNAEEAMWGRAAVAASLRHRYGKKAIEKFANEVGQSRTNIFRLAQVHAAFVEKSRRRDNLSFGHHVEALSAADPDDALDRAERERLSVRQLRAYLHPKVLPDATATAETATGDAKLVMKMRRGGRTRLVPRSPDAMAKFMVAELPRTDLRRVIKALIEMAPDLADAVTGAA